MPSVCASRRPFLNLLGDESNAVRMEVMASLVQTLDQFCIANEEARTRAFADFLPALLAADAGCGYCWRIHHHLMLALPHFVHMFTSDEVCLSLHCVLFVASGSWGSCSAGHSLCALIGAAGTLQLQSHVWCLF